MSIKPVNYPLAVYKGDDFDLTFTWADAADAPFDLTTYTAIFEAASAKGETPFISLTESTGIALGSTTDNVVVSLTAAETDLLAAQSGEYTLRLISSGAISYRVFEGPIQIVGEI